MIFFCFFFVKKFRPDVFYNTSKDSVNSNSGTLLGGNSQILFFIIYEPNTYLVTWRISQKYSYSKFHFLKYPPFQVKNAIINIYLVSGP